GAVVRWARHALAELALAGQVADRQPGGPVNRGVGGEGDHGVPGLVVGGRLVVLRRGRLHAGILPGTGRVITARPPRGMLHEDLRPDEEGDSCSSGIEPTPGGGWRRNSQTTPAAMTWRCC